MQILDLILTDTFFISVWQQLRKSKMGFTPVTENPVAVPVMCCKQMQVWFGKWVQCLSMFLGQHYLFLHWHSCSQIPQNKHSWEHWACMLRTWAWRCTSASKRKSQAIFLGKQEKSACNRFLISDCDCPPFFAITETPALSLADSHYSLYLSLVIISTF